MASHSKPAEFSHQGTQTDKKVGKIRNAFNIFVALFKKKQNAEAEEALSAIVVKSSTTTGHSIHNQLTDDREKDEPEQGKEKLFDFEPRVAKFSSTETQTVENNEIEQKLKDAMDYIAALEKQAELDRKEIEQLENIIYKITKDSS